jgi:hypothetical protein
LIGWSGPHIMIEVGGDGKKNNIGDLNYQVLKTI